MTGERRVATEEEMLRQQRNPHNGWLVRWDEPVFGVTEGYCSIPNLEVIPSEEG